MPWIEGEHNELIWSRIYKTASVILSNNDYINKKRRGELNKIIRTEFNVSERTARQLIRSARFVILEVAMKNTDQNFGKAIVQREFIINSFLESNDLSKALDAIKDRDKLNGLYNLETKQEITVKNVDMSKFTEHGLQRLIKGDKIELVLTDPLAIKND